MMDIYSLGNGNRREVCLLFPSAVLTASGSKGIISAYRHP